MAAQGRILSQLAALIDSGRLASPATEILRPITAAHLRAAHAKIESGRTVGKIVLAGWDG
jgi:NADPH2:quinone reductase